MSEYTQPRHKCGVKGCRKWATHLHTYYKQLSLCDEHWNKQSARDLASSGGKARAEKLSPERRSEIAKHAVAAREAKRKNSV
jgi:hypothetical protein